ncbi:hypothetical protein [Dyadobacter jiangsuensis]|uniref:Uncharacterized protein n=1 Tax=Dyadobacter jiangsuensis TaxID=1591085 RepID=A0A2P8FI69_9BACT|nr:hypothetical protein [Dyadobacter jiangsuensis]PSL21419.1 hypothetical protein CLV60_12236 [Dyadobacter jiangsuensis]
MSFNLDSGSYCHYSTAARGRDKELDNGGMPDILENSYGRLWLIGTFRALLCDIPYGQVQKLQVCQLRSQCIEHSKRNIWMGVGDEAFILKNGQHPDS